MSPPGRAPAGPAGGFSVAEALVALLLGCLVVGVALTTLARQRAVQSELTARAERLGAARLARHLLGWELRAARGGGAYSVGPDSLALRAYRGVGLVCSGERGPRELWVAASGVRAADPAKDSVELLLESGATAVLGLEAREGSGRRCGASPDALERWTLSAPLPAGVVMVRWFERGSYHLSGGALRYRRGLAGRQPLTSEVVRLPESSFVEGASGLRLDLVLGPGRTAADAWSFVFRGAPGG
ncbi:MAG: hypothetical protein Q8N53_15890 [Longimicrobiales bacterium]|nr:hypothetical protein [Longimicrobiales bacterium]